MTQLHDDEGRDHPACEVVEHCPVALAVDPELLQRDFRRSETTPVAASLVIRLFASLLRESE
jgi:hypothetical protein